MSVHSPNEHICKLCNKYYKSRQSLWNHTNNYHNTNDNKMTTNDNNNDNIMTTNDNIMTTNSNCICKFCNKILSHRNSRWKHEQKCNKQRLKESENLENKLIETESKINAMSQQIAQLLNEKAKIHPKTLQKINKNLINNINNGTIINNTFVKFGKVELSSILNTKEILSILNQPFISIEETTKLKI
jgi:hypothetical protein